MSRESKIDIVNIINDESSKGNLAHKIWMAGLGALAAGAREGRETFNGLVEQGKKIESQVEKATGKTLDIIGNIIFNKKSCSSFYTLL